LKKKWRNDILFKNEDKLKEEAEDRSKIYEGMSLEEKLKLIESRRGESKKEKTKILKQIKEKDNEKEN
tara:strand:- start:129 stop:332 length:204 start_codon:yes stop_codon:yes gene_type:complete